MLTVVAACSTGSDAVDQGRGRAVPLRGCHRRGSVIPVAKRRLSGDVRQKLIVAASPAVDLAGQGRGVELLGVVGVPCKDESPMLERGV